MFIRVLPCGTLFFIPRIRRDFMKLWRRWASVMLALAVCASLLAGCEKDEEGISLAVCLGSEPASLDPIYATAEGDQTIVTHLYENLMRVTVDVSGSATVSNGMAKSYSAENNHDGTVTWTFRLRSAKWSDGRAVKAEDFVYAWRRLADPASGSPYASILSIVAGYDEVRATGDTSLLQVSARNDSTLEVVLTGDYDWFLSDVCTSPATSPLREDVVVRLRDAAVERNKAAEAETGTAETEKWWSQPEKLVTNGPYQIGTYTGGASLALTDYSKYYGSHSGPAELVFRFADSAEEAQALYDGGAVDLIWPLTEERMAELAENENWVPATTLGTYTLLLNCGRDVFSDPLVRQALVTAIDRETVAQAAGVTARAAEGMVPAGVPGGGEGDFRTDNALLDNDPETYPDRCARARELLEDAGYDRGTDLGELEYLYEDTPENAAVAQALAQQWKQVLGVTVTPVAVAKKELRTALKEGTYTLAGLDVRAFGNDAECFLMPWTSGSENNYARYENSAYDTLLSIIARAEVGSARMGCLHDAEVLLLEDSAVAPLYTTVTAWTVRETLTGVCRDARGWFSLSGVTVHSA